MDVDIEDTIKDWLVLSQTKGLGHHHCGQLLSEFKTPSKIFQALPDQLKQIGVSDDVIHHLANPDNRKIERAMDWLSHEDHHLITLNDTDYPELLKNIYAAPVILFAIGQRSVLHRVPLAIVGSRNPSESGKKLAREFAKELANAGYCICSGLALGIDYYSHLGALDANCPTIAVLGNGLDKIYPARHKNISSEITKNGLLISEFFPGVGPVPGNFPQRNRIISGLSVGVLVVEAAKKSGSLITARYAIEQAREVFAIPGSLNNPLARGTHSLIKQGAKLVESTADILEELAPLTNVVLNQSNKTEFCNNKIMQLEPEYIKLLDIMGYEEVFIDALVISSGLTAEEVSSMLLIMELEGLIESRHGGKYCRLN